MCTLIIAWLIYKVASEKCTIEIPWVLFLGANIADVVIVYFIAQLVAKVIN